MGILLAGAVVERISGTPLPQFLADEFFAPLGMTNSWLGLGPLDQGGMVRVVLRPEDEYSSWGWNSPYWRGLGAPWGGLHTTTGDYARLLQLMLAGGEHDEQRLFSAGMVRAMLSNQLAGMPDIAESARNEHAWGLGWRLNLPAGAENMPESRPASLFGHAGATGTMAWADADSWAGLRPADQRSGAGSWRESASRMSSRGWPRR